MIHRTIDRIPYTCVIIPKCKIQASGQIFKAWMVYSSKGRLGVGRKLWCTGRSAVIEFNMDIRYGYELVGKGELEGVYSSSNVGDRYFYDNR